MDSKSAGSIGKYTSLALLLPISTLVGFLMGYGLDSSVPHALDSLCILGLWAPASGVVSLIRELDKEK